MRWLGISLVVAATAHASPWRGPSAAAARVHSERAASLLTAAHPIDTDAVDRALAAYQQASLADPNDPEPFYAIGLVLRAQLGNCQDVCSATPRAQQSMQTAILAFHQFMALAPRDPRVISALEACAILHTKRGTRAHLETSIAHYELLLSQSETPSETLRGNLAEDYMMLGRLEEANALFREIAKQPRVSTIYGYAVSLDRDGQGSFARQLIAGLGRDAFDDYRHQVERGDVFYVPVGEVHYYIALAAESLGEPSVAIGQYRRFIASGAHPQFAPQATASILRLTKAQRR